MGRTTQTDDWLRQFVHASDGTDARRQQLAKGSRALADPLVGPKLRASYNRYVQAVNAQQESGAGLLADEQIRYFQREYHNRFIAHGSKYLPTNYRIAKSFFESRSGAPGFYLLPEKDYQFSFTDFLDYITGPDAPQAALELGYGFLDGQTYNTTSTDLLGELLLETKGEGSYAVRAASIVRRGDELVMMLSLAEQLTADRLFDISSDRSLASGVNAAKPRIAEFLAEAVQKPVYVENSNLLATIALVRFNLRERRMESRCILRDLFDIFRTWTDDIDAFGLQIDVDAPAFQNMIREIDACDVVWEIAKTLTLFPAYLAAKIDCATPRQERTKLGAVLPTSLKKQRELKDAPIGDKVLFRTISAIKVPQVRRSAQLEGRTYSAPIFQVAVDGFWRTLAPKVIGHGPGGEETLGRTWVRSHIRHKDKSVPTGHKVVYIKASLSEARARLDRFRKQKERAGDATLVRGRLEVELPLTSEGQSEIKEGRAGAFVYIMRCAAHSDNLFKVGFTDRDPDVRAKELSATTSSPLPFMVVHAWAVSDGLAAERCAHAALSQVRLSESREFFLLGYEELRDHVATAVRPWILAR